VFQTFSTRSVWLYADAEVTNGNPRIQFGLMLSLNWENMLASILDVRDVAFHIICDGLYFNCVGVLKHRWEERQLCRLREQENLLDQLNVDLTYAVCLNLAIQHQAKIPPPTSMDVHV
jgi:hypothetical protein